MNQPLPHGEDVALFIDWENFKISLATGHRTPNVSALKEEVSNHGRVVVAKAYADWVARTAELRGASQFINDPPALYAAGIEPVYVPTRLFLPGSSSSSSGRTTRIKNSVDVKMTADCIECAHTYPNISTYVLVSGDSDFIPGQMVDKFEFQQKTSKVLAEGGEPATAKPVFLGITRSSLLTDSFLSAASFQETTRVLTQAAVSGAQDWLLGLKENVIIGRLIPAQIPIPGMDKLLAPDRVPELSEMAPAAWLGIGETPPAEFNVEEAPAQIEETDAPQGDEARDQIEGETDDEEIDGDDGLDDEYEGEDDGDEILGVESTNGHSPQSGIGEIVAEETNSSSAVLETGEPPLDLGEPDEESGLSGQTADDEPEE